MGKKDDVNPGDDPKDDPTAPGGRLDPTRLIAESGNDAKAALQSLVYRLNDVERDNAKYRREIKELKGKVPEGSVILQGDELKAYETYKALGTAEDLKKKLEEADKDAERLKDLEEAQTLSKVAKVAGLNVEALSKLYKGKEFRFEGEGEEQKVYVKDGEKESVLADHIEANNKAFKASLYETQEPEPTRFPVQTPTTSKTGQKPTVNDIQKKKAATGDYSIF